jgi:hypothetical protein
MTGSRTDSVATDPAQAALLDRLGIILPKRMRLVAHEAPRLATTA